MNINNIELKNREVLYVFNEFENKGKYDKDIAYFRIENIDNTLHLSLLPEAFIEEKDIKLFTIPCKTSLNISTFGAMNNIIIKRGSDNKELAVFEYSKEKDFKNLSDSDYKHVINYIANNEEYNSNLFEVMYKLINTAHSYIQDKDIPISYPYIYETRDPADIVLLYNFDILSKERKEAIKKINEENDERTF